MPEIIVKLGDSIVQKNIFVKETVRIGRVPDNEIVIENLAVSRYHSVIECEEGRYILADLDSSNGTFVNGVRIKKTELQDRDVITVGKHKLYFYDQRAAVEPKPRPAVADIERTMLVEQQAPPAQAELEIVKGRQKGTRFVINGTQTSIGRGGFNDIQLTDWFVSKVHAVIERRGSEFIIRDLGSWRHTYVNGIMVHELPLAEGDTIQMGPTVQLSFNLVRQEQPLPSSARVPVELAPGSGESLRPLRFPDRETAESGELRIVRAAAAQPQSAAPASAILASAGGGLPPAPDGFSSEPPSLKELDLDDGLGLDDELDLGGHHEAPPEKKPEPAGMGDMDDMDELDLEPAAIPAPSSGVPPSGELSAPAAAPERLAAEPVDVSEPEPAAQPPVGVNGRSAPAPAPPEPVAAPPADQEIVMWERALKNKNPIIRKQAARQLQKLTGKEYDYS